MTEPQIDEFRLQQEYYAKTAGKYDDWHYKDDDEHEFALMLLMAYSRFAGIRSVLDIGSGTGRAVRRMKSDLEGVKVVGLEPSAELRAIGHRDHALGPDELVDGNALDLNYEDGSFDLVSAFAALHHIRTPDRAVAEMLRVARKGIFISDMNNFGFGSFLARTAKQAIDACGLWPVANWIKTRGKVYQYSETDGIYYSYSVFNNYELIKGQCSRIHIINNFGKEKPVNMYRSASHISLIGIKKAPESK